METGNQELSSPPDQGSSSAPQAGSGAMARYWEVAQPWVSLLSRLGLAGVLMFSAYTKLPPPLSVQSVEAYQLFPDGVNTFLGYTLPLFEFALAALLLVGLATRYVAAVTGLLMVVFIAGIVSAWARGLTIDCGCFGSGGQVAADETAYGWDIARDIGFMALAGIIMVWPRSPLAVDRLVGLYR
ncbi:methylamine utilization protein MauE [Haloactinospora alba]|uniref:Methylamine utilization protein MauE n=1 Tax=Haloactinospora alba TaxID=405555 RepID=A0A543NHX9_9ACTN|nr:methylamine utilization protein MauE [Haloactinospora alba]